jgi:RNase P subunit RPR2
VAPALPDASTRWRCGACGNLTRFDVTRTRRTTEFWHFDLSGEHRVETSTTEEEAVASVTCRWCGRSDAVEVVSRAEPDAATPRAP